MATNCTRCDGTGFLNADQIPSDVFDEGTEVIVDWIAEMNINRSRYPCYCHVVAPCSSCVDYRHDVEICDCCGDGKGWYGTPGEHYTRDDPPGPKGPYANNGGLCQCH